MSARESTPTASERLADLVAESMSSTVIARAVVIYREAARRAPFVPPQPPAASYSASANS